MTEITQADREAAAKFPYIPEQIALVQSFAHHREQAIAEIKRERDQAVEALREWLTNAECGFLDEIPTFKPDVYQNDLVAKTVATLASIEGTGHDRD